MKTLCSHLLCLAFAACSLTCLRAPARAEASSGLQADFAHPPAGARPWTFWYWMHNSVTRDSITHDLEAMAGHGLGGVYLFTIGGGDALTRPAVPSLTPLWWEHIDHTLREADRLGIKVRLNACDGWATAGSPDITPELSMQEITSATVILEGGREFHGRLPQPPTKLEHYRELAVVAYPEPVPHARTSLDVKPKVSTSRQGLNANAVVTGHPGGVPLPQPGWLQYEFGAPFTCRSITVVPGGRSYQAMRLEVQVSDDGTTFRSLGRLPVPRHGFQDGSRPMTTAFAAVTARFFRFVCDASGGEPGAEDLDAAKDRSRLDSRVRQIVLSELPTLTDWQGKSGLYWRSSAATTAAQLPDPLAVDPSTIVDLRGKVLPTGDLRWTPPAGGRWIVLRIGHTSTGRKNGPAGAGIGLEPDKLNPAAVPIQVASWFGKAADRQARLGTTSLAGSHVDSWECGSQNWSPVMPAEFKRRRGYDPLPYLPIMAGVPISSADVSERFLFDVRQTLAELVVENFFKPMVQLVRSRGGEFSAECIAPGMMSDGMAHCAQVDLPMGEFWYESVSGDKPNDILDAVHGARLYGKRIVQAEAFTHRDMDWDDSPFEMKGMGDHNFALGINRLVLHVWPLNATLTRPGVTLWAYGSNYSDGQTWWRPGKVWFDYLARCQAVLQRGVPVADVLYYVGENQPSRALLPDRLRPPLPAGYSYGSINRDALLNHARAERGRIVLPGGMSCSLLVLPPGDRMSPEVARAVAMLNRNGVPIVGPKPDRSPSLAGYPQCDDEVRRIAAEGWTGIRAAASLAEALKELKVSPDLEFHGVDLSRVWRGNRQYASPALSWSHRREGGTDVYFISNQEYKPLGVTAVFNIKDRQPELWDPATGGMRLLRDWEVQDGRTAIRLEFAPAESFFIVFREAAAAPAIVKPNFPRFRTHQAISGPWDVSFEAGRGAPASIALPALASLHTHGNQGVRHFSGTATYRCRFRAAEATGAHRLFLDLGKVANLAAVRLNGRSLGTVWKPPYRVEIPGGLAEENTLEIAVSTTWRNRMMADAELPTASRIAHAPLYDWKVLKGKPLVEAGLIGPVAIQEIMEGYPDGPEDRTPAQKGLQ